MSQFLNSYDGVIFGDHPAGLWAAKQLLDAGKKVLILPFGHQPLNSVLPRKVAQEFNVGNLPDRDRNPIQILTPQHRFRVESSLEQIHAEHVFHFAQPLGALSGTQLELDRGLQCLSRGSGPCLGTLTVNSITNSKAKTSPQRLAESAADTIYFESSASIRIFDVLINFLVSKGAHVAEPKQLKRIFIDQKTLVGVQIEGHAQMISCSLGFIAGHFDFVKPYLSESLSISSSPEAWIFEIQLDCSVDALPIGMTERMIYVEATAPIIEILQNKLGSFRLRTALPYEDQTLNRGYQRRIAERLLKVSERFIPDLEYNLKRVLPNLRDPEAVETVELPKLYPFEDLHRIPPELLSYGASSALGFKTPVKNLYITSEETDPSLGIWGAFQGVVAVFDGLVKQSKKDPQSSYRQISVGH
jgi:hypothetical protein